MCDIRGMEQLANHIAAHPGRTNSEWADMFGVSRPHLHALLNGDRQPSLPVAQRIADATGNNVPVTAWANLAALIAAVQGSR
jgi:plasmid maintenance system antidote protein VapI